MNTRRSLGWLLITALLVGMLTGGSPVQANPLSLADPVSPDAILAGPIASVTIDGPVSGVVNAGYTFTATVTPVTATLPVTYTWQATDQVTQVSQVNMVKYSWLMAGTKTITVTAVNSDTVAPVIDVHTIFVAPVKPIGTGLVTGRVTDTVSGASIISATVWAEPYIGVANGVGAQTDAGGYYTLTNLAAGDYRLSVGKPGYLTKTLASRVSIGINGAAPFALMQDDATPARDAYFLTLLSGKEPATDSASSATALATGYKTDDGNLAWLPGDPPNGSLTTIAETLRISRSYAIGVVSTVPFNHATPAGFASHNVSRNNYAAIAHEIIISTTPEVVVGGGYSTTTYLPLSSPDYIALNTGATVYSLTQRTASVDGGVALLAAANTISLTQGDKLFGLFGGSGGNFEYYTVVSSTGSVSITRGSVENPTLADATNATLPVLSQDPDGFFVLFEQGYIDWANHANNYRDMVGGIYDLDAAVRAAEAYVDQPGGPAWTDTLLVVTADHSNSYLRLNKPLGKGQLPQQVWVDRNGNGQVNDGEWDYPGGEVSYRTINHTNELVTLWAHGAGASLLSQYAGQWYPGTQIVDDTQVYGAMKRAAEEAGAKHIILFIGDGMNIAHEIAGSRYLYGTDYGLAWHSWGQLADGWTGYSSTWDVTAYNKYAASLGKPNYTIATADPLVGYNPGGTMISGVLFQLQPARIYLPLILR